MLLYSVNGMPLHDPANGYKIVDSSQWASPLVMRNTILTAPGRNGSIPVWNAPIEPATVQIRVRITGDTPEQLNDRWNTLIRRLGLGSNRATTLVRTRSVTGTTKGQEVSTSAQLSSIEMPDFSCAAKIVTSTLIFAIPDGMWFGAFQEQVLNVAGANQVVTAAANGSMPITKSMWKIKGSISTISVVDNVSQTGFTWAGGNVTGSQWLLVDLETFTAWIKATDDYNLSGVQVSQSLRSLQTGWLTLSPGYSGATSASSVTITSAGTSGGTVCTLRTKSAYH